VRAGYVALSRVRRCDDLLIMQPFDRSIFMRGELLQPKWMVKNMLKEPWLHEYEQHKIRQREKQKQERSINRRKIRCVRRKDKKEI